MRLCGVANDSDSPVFGDARHGVESDDDNSDNCYDENHVQFLLNGDQKGASCEIGEKYTKTHNKTTVQQANISFS